MACPEYEAVQGEAKRRVVGAMSAVRRSVKVKRHTGEENNGG